MSSLLRPLLLVALTLGLFTGCLTRIKTPATATGPSPEYQAALAKIVRVPQSHPLLDEGLVPVRALEIVAAYQDIARRGRFRELVRFYDTQSQSTAGHLLETQLLRREIDHGPALEVLQDLGKFPDNRGWVRYDFEFESVQRGRTQKRHISLREAANGEVVMIGSGS